MVPQAMKKAAAINSLQAPCSPGDSLSTTRTNNTLWYYHPESPSCI